MTGKTKLLLILIFGLALLGCATPASVKEEPGAAGEVVVKAVEISDYSVKLEMSADFPKVYTVYKPADPYTVTVDLPGVGAGPAAGKVASTSKGIFEVRVSELEEPSLMAKVEIVLDSPSEVRPLVEGNSLIINVLDEEADFPEAAEAGPAEAAAAAPEAAKALGPAKNITGMEFLADDSKLKLVISADGTMKPKVFTLDKRIVIDVPGVKSKASLPKEVVFPVRTMRQGVYEDKVRIVVVLDTLPDFVSSTIGRTVVIAMPLEGAEEAQEPKAQAAVPKPGAAPEAGAPMPQAGAEKPMATPMAPKPKVPEKAAEVPMEEAEEPLEIEEDEVICSKRISLDFQDAEVVPIFRFIGDICGYNVVIHPSVSGRINLKLTNVPANQAMDIILELSNLGMSFKEAGKIMTVAPTSVFTQSREEEARLKQASQRVAEIVEEEFRLNYMSAPDFKKIIDEKKLLDERSSIYIDEITNTMEVAASADTLKNIKKLMRKYDNPEHGTMQYGSTPQIIIEAKMVEVSKDYTRALGIRWGGTATDDNFSFIDDESNFGVSVNTPVGAAGPDASVAGALLSVGYSETFELSMSLEALETVGQTKSLANPRVMTLNGQAANITQGTQIPYSTIEDGTAKTEFQTAALSLNVTPEIKPDGIIEMQISASNDTPVAVGNETGVNTQSVKTQARVKNGGTIVLGGIYTNTETESETRVPVLGRIPFLGWLFKTKSEQSSPKELLIFITPTIVSTN